MSHMYYIVLPCIYVIRIGFRCNAKIQKTRPADLVFLLLQQWNPWITRAGKGRQAVIFKPPIWLGSTKIYGICQEENSNIFSTTKFEVPYVQTNPYYVATPDPVSRSCAIFSFGLLKLLPSIAFTCHLFFLVPCVLRFRLLARLRPKTGIQHKPTSLGE